MPSIGLVHFASALVALGAGAVVLARPKGTWSHRKIGWLYVAAMLTLNVTALMIYRLTGVFGPFHIAAVVSLATVTAGIVPVWRRRPAAKWLDQHYFFMAYSYLGLVAAAVAETATRVPVFKSFAGGPRAAFWIVVVVASITVFVAGGRMIRRRVNGTLAPFRRGSAVA